MEWYAFSGSQGSEQINAHIIFIFTLPYPYFDTYFYIVNKTSANKAFNLFCRNLFSVFQCLCVASLVCMNYNLYFL